jgi:ribosomal protein S18 acetylase RimI-like enzyme
MGEDVRIRSGEAADAASVNGLLVETWHDTYDSLLGFERVSTITASWHSEEALSRQIADPKLAFLVAADGTRIVGHALGSVAASGDIVLSRLYVEPERQSQGIGRRLIVALARRFSGASAMAAAVHAENAGALRFYRAAGFEIGEAFEEEGIPHLRVRLQLAGGDFSSG